ncbi:MAG TPA: phosphoenolpyruvate--protein phosphotransferase [Elusimicrobia bacterium]|nr:MAG: phosphoenolpyruvate--protein phosphotransferase [Elusimicrobia bacterium RIFOXYA12_FULL_49_49]OGS09690.1 MAG: phosphoenolpyruvate--protein phosphotransferase [Elusimicrobia bacterium RIFOXYB1_FULL_48_9]OGS15660.1 MAG: phosphoenolpyruvate--protein phosphotransferase [Elusimicrobia bacterium RIFOXYA2_FULL_47_53]OGS26916.1 MAG: phosphoenolpyruvate--protein phosphotransferase [Elusimicrobia bacterium RIFOXYB12_FULL_50_12]OGS30759.1 MAG: phosphoenolpyruvate--protein phosphotransferase [Elusi
MLQGIAASPGIVIGKVFLLEDEELTLVQKEIGKDEVKREIQRFRDALVKTRAEMVSIQEKILKTLGKEYARLSDAYLLILEDPLITRDVIKRINEGVNAEYALFKILERVIHSFEMIDDEYFRERKHDIQDVGKKILRHLLGKERRQLSDLTSESIVVGHNLTPSDTISMKESLIKGFVTDIGGRTSHTAIVAQGLEIPAVVGLKNVTGQVNEGEVIIVDGNQGLVIINPTAELLENYRREQEIQLAQIRELEKLRDLPAQTTDSHRVTIAANIDNVDEVKSVLSHGAEGIGLYRTEFLYFNKSALPSEEEHYQNYLKVAQKMLPYSVIIRTIDLGGDKLSHLGLEGITVENNPFMGLRAIRLCLKYPSIFKTQLRGILRASAECKIKIMYPMISGINELRDANKILEETKAELRKEGKRFDENIEVGVMIEVPSAALTADLIAKEADFLSVGTNDLIQYTLAVDRVNENVANLYEPLHLSILRLLKTVIDAGHNAGKWVGMCGEMAADATFTTVLLGLGLNEFSVSPVQIPKIKRIVRSVSIMEARALVAEIMECTEQEEIIKIIKKREFKGMSN